MAHNALNDLSVAKTYPSCGWEMDDETMEANGVHPDFYGTRANGRYRNPLPQIVDRDRDGTDSFEDDVIARIDAERALMTGSDELGDEPDGRPGRDEYERLADAFGGDEASDTLERVMTDEMVASLEENDDYGDEEEILTAGKTIKFAGLVTRESSRRAARRRYGELLQSQDLSHRLGTTRPWKRAAKARKQYLRHLGRLPIVMLDR